MRKILLGVLMFTYMTCFAGECPNALARKYDTILSTTTLKEGTCDWVNSFYETFKLYQLGGKENLFKAAKKCDSLLDSVPDENLRAATRRVAAVKFLAGSIMVKSASYERLDSRKKNLEAPGMLLMSDAIAGLEEYDGKTIPVYFQVLTKDVFKYMPRQLMK